MQNITFLYNSEEINIPCSFGEKLNTIVDRFCEKAKLLREKIYFLFNGQILDEQIKENQIEKNEDNKKIILVFDIERNTKIKEVIIQSNEIICPKCQESACISTKNYKICISQCKNGHKVDNICLNDFGDTQKINISSIICDNCKMKNKGNVNNNEFFRCITCKKNLCPICRTNHNNTHYVIIYEQKNCICEEHGEAFTSFCKKCKKDICMSCDEKHDGHDIEFYQKMRFNKEQTKENVTYLRNNIDKLNEVINNYVEKLNQVKIILENYYNIINNIYKTINTKSRCYNKLCNIKFINNNDFNNEIQKIINEENINNKIIKLLKISEEVSKKNKIDNEEKPDWKIKKIESRINYNSMKELLDELIENDWIKSQNVFDTMMKVDRADFSPINPYKNFSQPIPCDAVISSPLIHAFSLESLKDHLKEGYTALDVGFGSGYITVAMSKMMNDNGHVVGIDINKTLYDFGKTNIMKHHKKLLDDKKIELILGDGKLGFKSKAPYNCIYVGVGTNEPPKALLEQLVIGGRLVIPIGPKGSHYIYLIDKLQNGKFKWTKTISVNFSPLL